jgi:flotillin
MVDTVVLLLTAILFVINFLAIVAVYAARYKRVPPNRAMIVYGRRFPQKGFMVLKSGGKFILPIIESAAFVSLEPFEVDVDLEDVSLGPGPVGARTLRVHATGTARVSPDEKDLERAASSLSGKTSDQMRATTESILQDHIRRTFTALDYAPSYPAATESVRAGAQADLNEFGVRLVSLSLIIRQG